MKVSDFDYGLPPERIAQRPAARREGSRLLVLDGEHPVHARFEGILERLHEGDLLVLNDTKVIPARLVGRKATGGRVELLLLDPAERGPSPAIWHSLVRAGRSPAPGSKLSFGAGLSGRVTDRDGEIWTLTLKAGSSSVTQAVERLGRVPLPPYIRREDSASSEEDRLRYQTVYARHPGAVAAPTAGLHFSKALLRRIEARGVELAFLTLHVGLGTFQPVREERVEDHAMHDEWVDLPASTAEAIGAARRRGGRIVAVGTTVVRALESRAEATGGVRAGEERCSLFIYPGYRFRVVDALVTNFHLPRSTLLMLVAAFAGRDRLLAAYREAVTAGYRFYSYGDAMFVTPR